jgi:hypothetical protein
MSERDRNRNIWINGAESELLCGRTPRAASPLERVMKINLIGVRFSSLVPLLRSSALFSSIFPLFGWLVDSSSSLPPLRFLFICSITLGSLLLQVLEDCLHLGLFVFFLSQHWLFQMMLRAPVFQLSKKGKSSFERRKKFPGGGYFSAKIKMPEIDVCLPK